MTGTDAGHDTGGATSAGGGVDPGTNATTDTGNGSGAGGGPDPGNGSGGVDNGSGVDNGPGGGASGVRDGRPVGRPPRAKRSAVMMDVARLAGVSHQTVSRVLNEHPSVRRETRERVLAAMRELDYQPNSAARTLVTNRSQTLGLVTYDTTLVGPSFMVYAVERAAREAGYFVSIASARSLEQRSVMEAIRRLREQSVEGIITIAPLDSALAALEDVPGDMPLVGMGVGDATGVAMVGLDNVGGATLATRHLLDLGHRTVHHVAGPEGWPEARERMAGWRRTLESAGAAVPEPLIGDWSPRSGYEAGRRLAADRSVTAIYCANDQTAIGMLRALAESERRVPWDVSIVGFDDIPEAPFLSPPLTTVVQDFAELGRRCVDVVLQQIATARRCAEQLRLAPRLVVRDSTAIPTR